MLLLMLPEVVLPVGKRTALSPPVLVAGDTIHGVFPAIEIEPLAGHDLIMTQTQQLNHLVDLAAILIKTRNYFIQIRIGTALPQMRLGDPAR